MTLRDYTELFSVFVAILLFALFGRKLLDPIVEALNNFRGGPPTPMHPSPSGDTALLRKRLRTIREDRK
jgi:hypothetical protein